MKLAVVTGQIVCTVRHHGLAHDKLLMVEMIDPQGNPDGQCAVAIDNACSFFIILLNQHCWLASLQYGALQPLIPLYIYCISTTQSQGR